MALSEKEQTDIAAAVAAALVKDLKTAGSQVVVAVERIAPAPVEPKKLDPYRPGLQFLTGLLAFCLALIVALFAALDPNKGHAINALASQVLMGMAITTAIGTAAVGLIQLAKSLSPDKLDWLGAAGAFVALVAVAYGINTVVQLVSGATKIVERQCIAKPADGIGDAALINLLKKYQGAQASAYAEARARDCFAAGDLASSAAWSNIASPPKP